MNSKDKVLKSAFDLMVLKGNDDLSINDMLKELNMTKGGFYHYFKSRDQLMCEIMKGCMLDMLIKPLRAAKKLDDGSTDVRDILKIYFCLLPDDCSENDNKICNIQNYFYLLFEMLGKYPELRCFYKEYYTEHLSAVRETVLRGINEGKLIKYADAYGCAEMMMSARNGILALNIIYRNIDLESRLESAFETIWNEITCRGDLNERLAKNGN